MYCENMKKVIIYHSNCTDGFCSAWLCHLVWPDAEFIPANYGWKPPDVRGKDVLIVDFSYDRPVLEQMAKEAAAIKVLDHHETAERNLAGLPFCTFDQSKSGAHMTWDYLVSEGLLKPQKYWLMEESLHWLVQYVEDYDLHKQALPNHHEICAAIRNHDTEFDVWNQMAKRTPESMVAEGKPVLRYQDWLIDHHVRYAQVVEIGGVKGIGCQCSMNKLWSRVADGIMAKYPEIPFAVIWQDTDEGFRIYSLRSRHGFHVGKLAESLGGGGHPGAAAFKVNYQTTLEGPITHSKLPRPDSRPAAKDHLQTPAEPTPTASPSEPELDTTPAELAKLG